MPISSDAQWWWKKKESISDPFMLFHESYFLTCDRPDDNKMRSISITRVVLFHVIFQIPGIAVLAHFLAAQARVVWEVSHRINGLAAWAFQPQPPKVVSILEYVLLLIIGGLLILVISAYLRRDHGKVEMGSWRWAALGVYELACLVASAQRGMPVVWLVLAIILPAWLHSRYRSSLPVVVERIYLAIACGSLGCALWVLLATSWSPDVRFINDYADFPEYTHMEDSRLVENGEFMRTHRIPGRFKVDLCGQIEKIGMSRCLHLSKAVFGDASEPSLLFPPGNGLVYNWEAETLVAYRPLNEKEKTLLQSLWGVKRNVLENEMVRPNTRRKTVDSMERGDKSSPARVFDSTDVEEFIGKNNSELDAQNHLGYFFYHHSYLYLPALERAAFPGKQVMPAQYGEGMTWSLGTLINYDGNPTFQSYYTIFWGALYAYLILLGVVTWRVTRDAWAAILAVSAAVSIVLAVSYDALRMAPGFNPIRHFPDLLCFLAVAYNVKWGTLLSVVIRAASIGMLIWWNREFGLFFLGGSAAWLLFEASSSTGRWIKSVAQLALEVILSFIVLFSTSSESVSELAYYSLIGIGAPITPWRSVFGWLALWIPLIGYLAWARFIRVNISTSGERAYLLDVAGVGVIYTMLITSYVLWNRSPNHVAVMLLCAVVPLTAFVVWLLEVVTSDRVQMRHLTRYGTAIAMMVLVFMLIGNQTIYGQFERVFKDHRLMRWHFPGLVGTSTADPGVMLESVALIEKYQPQGRILLLSRYDNLLNILTNRPTVLPYVELPGAMVSREMVDKITGRILQSDTPFIYVDRDLLDEREWQVPRDERGKADPAAVHRVGSLAALGQVFRRVAHCFSPGEVRGALRVWHRTCKVEKS